MKIYNTIYITYYNLLWLKPMVKGLILACSVVALQGNAPMDPLYDLQNSASIKANIFKIPQEETIHLFPVPQDNSIGTNDLGDAVNIFQFIGKRIWIKTFFANSVKHISDGGHYLPVFAPNKVGFAKERFFVLGDFSTRKIQDYDIIISLEKTIINAGVADASRNRFFFEIESENPNSEDYRDVIKFIWLVETDNKQPNVLKKIKKQKGSVWLVLNQQLFLCDFVNNEIKVFDSNLNPSSHPLVNVINKHKGDVDYVKANLHPALSFAILSGGSKGGQYVCWNQSFRSEKLRSLFGSAGSKNYQFSPDGHWVVFQKTRPEPKYSYIMPVSEKYPNYLGSPILLEGASFDRDHFAWTTNPVALVGASEGKLYRYDLTREAHPEATAYPSYWDYVVEKDLEKLKREKKQGLGLKP